jgi:TP901 family phage tail tape measure protein
MARAFNLTAEINLRGPSNIRTVVADIRRQLGSVDVNINPRINPASIRNITTMNTALRALNGTLSITSTNANSVSDALRNLGQSFNNVIGRNTQQGLNNATQNINNVGNNAGRAATQMQEFGRQSALAVRRFAAFTVVTSSIYAFTGALRQGISDFITFDKEFVRLQQVTGESAKGLQGLADQITKLATSLGVSSSELTTVAVTLAQAGLSAADTRKALEALAKSSLAPSFDDMNQTVEGSIALMRQFGIGAGDLESALGSVNAVAAQFAVEASDLIVAIQRTGGVFATASRGVSEGTDALNEFLAIFTSVRATTRESAETIATGLRTIFTRVQRAETIQALEKFGVTLTDLEGKFVGPFEAVKRLSEGLSRLDPRDLQFSQIVEELGGFRQIGKVIPLIQQFAVAQQALKTAQTGQASLSKDAATAQLSIANQIAKVREEFTALVRSIGESDSFRSFISLSLQLASGLIKLADAAKIVLPALTALATIRGLSALTQFGAGFAGAFGNAGGARGLGQRLGGGRRFASGGLVPGSGSRDTVPAMLTPGEFVIRKKAASAIGLNKLHGMNKYAGGGRVKSFARGGIAGAPMVDDILQTSGAILPKPSAIEALIRAGGGAIDIDRTLKRTIGDKAYSKAASSGAKTSVLNRYFNDETARLQDIKSSPLTGFGKSLQEAIRSGKLSPSKLSIISKSRRTRGVPEYLSQLFGIPVQNMIFTQGGNKQPALDAMRSKGPRAGRIGRYAQGGVVVDPSKIGAFFLRPEEGADRSPITIRGQGNIKNPLALKQLGIAPAANDAKAQALANAEIKTQQKLLGLQSDNKRKKIDVSKIIKNGKVLSTQSAREALYAADYTVAEVTQNFDPKAVQKRLRSGLKKGKLSVAGKIVPISGAISGYYPGKNDFETNSVASTVASNARKGLYNTVMKSIEPALSTLGNSVIGVDRKAATKGAKRIANDPNAQATTEGFIFEGLIQSITGAKLAGAQSNFDFPAGSIASARESLKNMFTDSSGEGLSTLIKADAKRSNTGKAIDSLTTKIINDINKGKFDGVNFVKYAKGGNVDTVPAMLTPGEFVINKKAAKKIGSSQLQNLNRADKISGFNKGGMVGGLQTFANGGGVQKFFAGGAVAAVISRVLPALANILPKIQNSFSTLKNTVTGFSNNLTTASRNVQQTGLIPSGSAGRNLMRQARAARAEGLSGQAFRDRMGGRGGMGGLGGFVALTAGGAAIEGASSLAGGESTTSGRMISNMGGDALNYGSIGATIGSFFGPWGTAIGGAAGALVGLTTGFFKAQKAAEEFAEKTRQAKIEKSSESISTLLDEFIKNPEANKENLDVGMADIFAELKSLAAQEAEKNLSKESLRTKTTTEIVTTQKAGSESATRILEAAMGKTGKTLDEVSASIDPKTFRILTQQIAQVSPEYIAKWQELVNETDPETQKELNGQLDDIRMKYSRVALAAKENEIIEKRRADEAAKIVKEIDKTLDIYRRANAYADKYAASLERLIKATDARTNDFSNAPKVQDVDRKNEEVLGNLSAFSFKEVRAAAGGVAGLAGGSPEAKALADQAVASKILADQLPALVKSTDITNRNQIKGNLTGLFQAQGINIETPEISKVLNDVGNRLIESSSDTDVDKLTKELEGTVISELSKTAQEGSQLLQKLTKTYNDTLQESINLQNKYNEAMGRSNEYMRKAGVIRLNAELDLAKALGNSPTLRQLNEPFEFEIKDLTKGLRDVGGLRANQAMDPAAIGLAMMRTSQENARLEAENAANLEKASGLGSDAAGNRQRADIAAANLSNVAALGKNKLALDEGRQALERLANDGTKAANALAKIQEEQQKVEGFGNFLEKVFTSSFDELFQMNRESAAFAAAQAQGPEFMRNAENRQLAFSGLNAQKELYSPQEFANLRADLLEKSLSAQGFQGQDFVGKLGMTVEEALNRIRGRVSEEDPNVIAYREAVNEQIKANEILGLLNKQQALIIQESMLDLQIFLAKDFPNILIQALADARADAGAANPKNLPVAVPPGGAVPPAAAAAAAAPVGVLPAPPAPGAGGVLDRLNAQKAQFEAQRVAIQKQIEEKMTKGAEAQKPDNANRVVQGAAPQAVVQANAQASKLQLLNAKQTFVEGEDAVTRAEKGYAPTAERKAFVQQELIAARKRQRLGQKLPTDDSVISASSFELKNIAEADKAQKRKDYLLSQSPSQRKKLFTAAEKEPWGLEEHIGAEFGWDAPQVKGESKPLAQYQQSKLSLRQAAASRYRPEVARRMFPDLYQTQNATATAPTQTPSGTPQVAPLFSPTLEHPKTGNQYSVTFGSRNRDNDIVPTTGGPAGGNGFQIQLDPNAQAFLDSLSSTFSTFNTYIDKLSAVAATIPPKIELTGNYVLDVQISGAAAFEALEKRMKELAVSLVEPKLAALRDEVSTATGGQVKSSATMGSPSSGATSSQGQ